MWVLGTNVLSRGITDCSITIGAAAALALGASRVVSGQLELTGLLIILLMGVEIFRPMRRFTKCFASRNGWYVGCAVVSTISWMLNLRLRIKYERY